MSQNKTTLYPKEYIYVYESSLDKTRKEIVKLEAWIYIISMMGMILTLFTMPLLVIVLGFGLMSSLMLNRFTLINKAPPLKKIGLHFDQKEKYLIHLGNAVTSIDDVNKPANVLNPKKSRAEGFKPEAVRYPILIADTMILTHMFVIGTTGAGKTTFLVNILEQLLMLGGGCLAVDGKGDQTVYEAFFNTAVHCGREDDFLVMNFLVPAKSNSMNPLLKGDADSIVDIIGNMLDTGGDNAFWSGRALVMMKSLLSILVPLKDQGIMFDPNGKKVDIMTFSFLGGWIDLQNLRMLYFTIKEATENQMLPDKLAAFPGEEDMALLPKSTQEEKDKFQENCEFFKVGRLQKGIDVSGLEQYLTSVAVNIHDPNAKIEEGSNKQHSNSFLMWNESLDLIGRRFGPIFDTAQPEVDMSDVVSRGRIVYVLLPALKVDTRTLSVLGKLILGFFKNAISVLLGDDIAGTRENREKGFAIRPRVPFWGVMDEYGAYAVEGFDNVLAQARSLKVSVAILAQEVASLKKASELEAERLLGNTGIKVILKLEEQKSVDEVISFLGEVELSSIAVSNVKEGLDERGMNHSKDKPLTAEMVKKLKAGHAYVMWAGEYTPALVRYFQPPISTEIPPFELFRLSKVVFTQPKNYIKDIIENNNNDHNLTEEENVDTHDNINEKLIDLKEFDQSIEVKVQDNKDINIENNSTDDKFLDMLEEVENGKEIYRNFNKK